MFLSLRSFSFADRLVLCLAGLPLLFLLGSALGEDPAPPCPGKFAELVACPKGNGTAKCDTYNKSVCVAKSYTEVYGGRFACGDDTTKTWYCYDQIDPLDGIAISGECSRTYACILSGPIDDNTTTCLKGIQVGNTTTAPLKGDKKCVIPVPKEP